MTEKQHFTTEPVMDVISGAGASLFIKGGRPGGGFKTGDSTMAERSIDQTDRSGARGRKLCPHGKEYGDNSHLEGLVMAAPYIICTCCLGTHYYIDSVSFTNGKSWGRSWSKSLCNTCGGDYTEWGSCD